MNKSGPWYFWFLTIILVWHVSAYAQDAHQIKNALGWADRWGNLSIWFDFDDDLNLGDGKGPDQLPMRLHYSSVQRFVGQGIGGDGWWVPLLESTVTEISESSVKLHTLSGNTETLHRDPKDGSLYATKDQQLKGKLKGDHFEVTDSRGWTFDYADGRLRSATTSKGGALRWLYDGMKVTAIESKQFGKLLSTFYDPKTGLLSRIDYNKDASISFKIGEKPRLVNVLGRTLVDGMQSSIAGISNKAGYRMDGLWEPDLDNGLMKFILTEKDGSKPEASRAFQWDPVSGMIKHDGEFAYTLTPNNDGREIFPFLERVNSKGQKESYKFDTKKMEAVFAKLDGSTVTYQYVGTPGPTFGKLRKSVQTFADGTQKTLYQAAYDASGKLMKLNTGGTAIKTLRVGSWNPAEAVPLITQFVTQEKEDLNIAGPRNLLVGAVIGGRPYVYFHDELGKMVNRVHLADYLKQHPDIKLPAIIPPWLVEALKNPPKVPTMILNPPTNKSAKPSLPDKVGAKKK